MKTQKTPVQKCRAEVGRVYKYLRNADLASRPVRIISLRNAADRLELVSLALRDHVAFLEKQGELALEHRGEG